MFWLVAIIVVTASYGNDSISSLIRMLAALSSFYSFSFLGPCACALSFYSCLYWIRTHSRNAPSRLYFFYFVRIPDFRAFMHHHFTRVCIESAHILQNAQPRIFYFYFCSEFLSLAHTRAIIFLVFVLNPRTFCATRNCVCLFLFLFRICGLCACVPHHFIRVCIEFAHILLNAQSRMFSSLLFFFKFRITTFTHFSIFLRFFIFIFFSIPS